MRINMLFWMNFVVNTHPQNPKPSDTNKWHFDSTVTNEALKSAANFSSSCFLFLRTTALFHCLLLTTISHLLLLLSLSLSLPSSSFRLSKIGAPPSQHHRNRFPRHVYPPDSTLCSLSTRACNFYMHDHHDPTVYAFISLTSETHNPSLDRFDFPLFRSSRCLFPTCHRPLRGAFLGAAGVSYMLTSACADEARPSSGTGCFSGMKCFEFDIMLPVVVMLLVGRYSEHSSDSIHKEFTAHCWLSSLMFRNVEEWMETSVKSVDSIARMQDFLPFVLASLRAAKILLSLNLFVLILNCDPLIGTMDIVKAGLIHFLYTIPLSLWAVAFIYHAISVVNWNTNIDSIVHAVELFAGLT
ncbi:hypothetical protein VNO80_14764 [Phaseolus coccineus]|uniref:Uncharacterized protein n=1 Tax=Phaseolus coccineus TaxID=3886 RepID=A0AAN9MP00_PHACN